VNSTALEIFADDVKSCADDRQLDPRPLLPALARHRGSGSAKVADLRLRGRRDAAPPCPPSGTPQTPWLRLAGGDPEAVR
jgi:hypothetical protein